MSDMRFRVYTAQEVHHEDDQGAVIVMFDNVTVRFTIAHAREFALAVEKAADQAELKLQN